MGSVITLDGYAQRFKRVNAIVHFLDDGFKNPRIASTSSCNRVNPQSLFRDLDIDSGQRLSTAMKKPFGLEPAVIDFFMTQECLGSWLRHQL